MRDFTDQLFITSTIARVVCYHAFVGRRRILYGVSLGRLTLGTTAGTGGIVLEAYVRDVEGAVGGNERLVIDDLAVIALSALASQHDVTHALNTRHCTLIELEDVGGRIGAVGHNQSSTGEH